MKSDKIKRLSTAALLAAVALIIFWIEAQIPTLTPIPGIKLGLSNIVTLFALYVVGPKYSTAILAVRILLGSLLTGQFMSVAYSFGGGVPAFVLCLILYRHFPINRLWIISVLAAIVHNTGQIAVAIAVTSTPELIVYYPILIISGMVSGVFTGLSAQFLLIKMSASGLVKLNIKIKKEKSGRNTDS